MWSIWLQTYGQQPQSTEKEGALGTVVAEALTEFGVADLTEGQYRLVIEMNTPVVPGA